MDVGECEVESRTSAARRDDLYVYVCACMCVYVAPRCRARFTLYGHEAREGRIERITWAMMEDIEGGDVQPVWPICQFLPGIGASRGRVN